MFYRWRIYTLKIINVFFLGVKKGKIDIVLLNNETIQTIPIGNEQTFEFLCNI